MLISLNIYGGSIKIRTAEELRQISTEVQNGRTYENEKIKLMNDIDLGATWDEEGNLLTGTAWTPIGTYAGTWDVEDIENSREFKGIFDGSGYTISGIYIEEDTAIGTGLFAYTGKEATIKNLQLGEGYITGYQDIGGLVGRNYGNIINCINNNTSIISNHAEAGGIVGRNCYGEIKNTKNYAEVKNTNGGYIGGIVGSMGLGTNSDVPGGKIITCESMGIVTSAKGPIGGITSYIKKRRNKWMYKHRNNNTK